MPEVDAVIGIGANADIADIVKRVIEGENVYEMPSSSDLPLVGERLLTTPEYWSYLKIADGCSNRCTYCAIPSIRGDFRSVPFETVIDEAKAVKLAEIFINTPFDVEDRHLRRLKMVDEIEKGTFKE